jgi:hypothetical protein
VTECKFWKWNSGWGWKGVLPLPVSKLKTIPALREMLPTKKKYFYYFPESAYCYYLHDVPAVLIYMRMCKNCATIIIKSSVVAVHAMKTYRANGVLAPLIRNFGGVVNITPSAAFIPGKEPRCPLSRRSGGGHSRSGRFRREKDVLLKPGFEPRIVPLVAKSLYRLSYPGF